MLTNTERRSLARKLLTLTWVFSILHSGVLYRDSLSTGLVLMVWYVMQLMYLFFSALQISFGYPPFVGAATITKKAKW